eukprot:CAMPEP_0197290764 /NCGR_PEP_ID=MMETSP0890-20130614/9968_1 /TAXON_ID=44058 ORGANISM="Aureoumbra lagunensis, Strain CCMP1510" /NCGR_SAMPLE_ID=MMETSP0890 /ASSEMBLY_ACC=CAM_ASM_000533 /LENGTH=69 /DNA_ID=CAMNT_0042763033 /DNA_START=278 /DNA_END=487 /DNA_ORIENTATION=+
MGKSADEIKKLRTQKPEIRNAQREAALRESKARIKKEKADKAKAKQQVAKQAGGGKKDSKHINKGRGKR